MKYPALALVVALTACVLPPDNYPATRQVRTPADTLWTRAVSRYSEHQKDAVDYAVRCDAVLSATVQPCDVVVDELAEIDKLAAAVQADGEQALRRDDLDRLNEAIVDLDAVGDELKFTIMKGS